MSDIGIYRLAGGMGDFMVGLGRVRSCLRLRPKDKAVVVVDHPHSLHIYRDVLAVARFVDDVIETPLAYHPQTDPEGHAYFGEMNEDWRAEIEGRYGVPVSLDLASGEGQYLSWMGGDDEFPLPRLDPTDFDLPQAQAARDEEYVCIQPFSSNKNEDWRAFPRLALDLVWSFGVRVFLLGGGTDADLIRECFIEEGVESSMIISPSWSMLESLSLVSKASLVIGTDSWAVHAAGLFGISSIMLADEPNMCQIIADGYKNKLGGIILDPDGGGMGDILGEINRKRTLFKGRGVR